MKKSISYAENVNTHIHHQILSASTAEDENDWQEPQGMVALDAFNEDADEFDDEIVRYVADCVRQDEY